MSLFNEADVRALWRCARDHNCTIPDEALDAMRDALAATLRQAPAQGGVTEAMDVRAEAKRMHAEYVASAPSACGVINNWDALVPTAKLHWTELAADRIIAALSTQQGQGEAVCTVGMFRGNYGESYDGFSREDAARLNALPAGTKLYTAPPAQPAERVPEFDGERYCDMVDAYDDAIKQGWNREQAMGCAIRAYYAAALTPVQAETAAQGEEVGVVTTDFNAHAATGVRWLPGVVPAEGTKLYTAPPAQPAERVPEAMPERTDMDGYSNGYVKGWNDCRERTIAASPSPARGDGGEG